MSEKEKAFQTISIQVKGGNQKNASKSIYWQILEYPEKGIFKSNPPQSLYTPSSAHPSEFDIAVPKRLLGRRKDRIELAMRLVKMTPNRK